MSGKETDQISAKAKKEDVEWVHSTTYGVHPINLGRRLVYERERLIGMTDEERKWRAQWVKDQQLAPGEPKFVPDYFKETNNPIRRFLRYPLDRFEERLVPIMGELTASMTRNFCRRFIYTVMAIYTTYYYFKYVNVDQWQRARGWKVVVGRQRVFPGDEGYPCVENLKPQDFDPETFRDSPI